MQNVPYGYEKNGIRSFRVKKVDRRWNLSAFFDNDMRKSFGMEIAAGSKWGNCSFQGGKEVRQLFCVGTSFFEVVFGPLCDLFAEAEETDDV